MKKKIKQIWYDWKGSEYWIVIMVTYKIIPTKIDTSLYDLFTTLSVELTIYWLYLLIKNWVNYKLWK